MKDTTLQEVINIEHISKSFGEHTVLDDVTLCCQKGKIYGIVGYNGSGKTVLFKCICEFLKVNKGKITIRNKVLHKDIDMIPDAGIIIEHAAFLHGFSGLQTLEMLYMIRNKKDKKHVQNMMTLVGLDPKNKTSVEKYSLGMRQRLAIAQAIMEEQSILILDEPMNGLDKDGVADMRKLFMRLKEEGKTMILASHNREDIDLLCDEVYEMEHGRLMKMEITNAL